VPGEKSILIIGGGVIGLCIAYCAMREGHTVTILERGAPDHDGCSLGNAGMIVPSHIIPLAAPGIVTAGLKMMSNPESPFSIRMRPDPDLMRWVWAFTRSATAAHVSRSAPLLRDLHLASRKCYERLSEKRGNDFGLVKKGLLMLCKSDHVLHEEAQAAEVARKAGLPAELLTPEESAKLDPNIRMEIAGAIYFPLDCHLNPRQFVAGMTRDLEAGGVKFLWSTEATGWQRANGRIKGVQTKQGVVWADEYVLAGGSWSAELTKELGLSLLLQAGKGYSITLPAPRQLPEICSILTEARVAVTPMGNSLRFAGTMEITGLDLSINQARVNGIKKSIPAYFPAFSADDFEGLPVWSGLRPCSPDGLPYIGRSRQYPNLSIATGHAMMGLSLGPVTGQLIADILSDRQPTIDLTLLNPDRFA
jgi:D-amino-acid dehydrogenase